MDVRALLKDAGLAAFVAFMLALPMVGFQTVDVSGGHGITVVTDTTERAPTFSMRAFENDADPAREPALSYVHIPETGSALEAWRSLLRREPRTLEWDGVAVVAGRARLLGFDFSDLRPPTISDGLVISCPDAKVHRVLGFLLGGAKVGNLIAQIPDFGGGSFGPCDRRTHRCSGAVPPGDSRMTEGRA